MIICHVCKAECEETAELCLVCGAVLAREEEPSTEADTKEEMILIENPVLAVSVEDVVTAEIFRDILKENTIPFTCDSEVSGESMKVVFGGSFVAEDIYVDETNLDKALALYDEVLNAEPEFSEGDMEFDFEED